MAAQESSEPVFPADTVAAERALASALQEVPFAGYEPIHAYIVRRALEREGWRLIRSDSWRLRSDFNVVLLNDGGEHG